MRPLIGITCNFDLRDEVGRVSHMGQQGQKWQFLADDYIAVLEKAGGIPVVLPVVCGKDTAVETAARIDGLLLSGGHDIDPLLYGRRVKSYCGTVMPERDRFEIGLAEYILNRTSMPVLGICRGLQILNVAAGGDLYQDLEREGGFSCHFTDMYPPGYPSHEITLTEGSRIHQIYRKKEMMVNSYHHQGIKVPGRGFAVTALSDDGTVEALEMPGSRFVAGVQWHPEMMKDSEDQQKIFKAFVHACTIWRNK